MLRQLVKLCTCRVRLKLCGPLLMKVDTRSAGGPTSGCYRCRLALAITRSLLALRMVS